VFNGFAALLTDDEVRALKKNSGVASITADSILQLDTATPSFLAWTSRRPGSSWAARARGRRHHHRHRRRRHLAGEPGYADRLDENGVPSHSGSNGVRRAASQLAGQLPGGRRLQRRQLQQQADRRALPRLHAALHWTEFRSPRDSWPARRATAAMAPHGVTAGGNNGTLATSNGVAGQASGMAPRARIAAYKVCWTAASTAAERLRHGRQRGRHRPGGEGWRQRHQLLDRPERGGGAFNEPTSKPSSARRRRRVRRGLGGNRSPARARRAGARVAHQPVADHGRQLDPQPPLRGDAMLGNGSRLEGASSNANTPARR
jgi:hypothetical protein